MIYWLSELARIKDLSLQSILTKKLLSFSIPNTSWSTAMLHDSQDNIQREYNMNEYAPWNFETQPWYYHHCKSFFDSLLSSWLWNPGLFWYNLFTLDMLPRLDHLITLYFLGAS